MFADKKKDRHTGRSQKDRAAITEYEAMFGPQPLPPHFGEIDVAAPFDAKRFYKMLRCSGINPWVWLD
jgi:hypothetical protein